jgi:hypothetical protein
MDQSLSSFYLDFPGYFALTKPRNIYGGGVAVLVRSNLDYIEDHSLDHLQLELISIRIKLAEKETIIVSLYNPPSQEISTELFEILNKSPALVLGGDLNSKNIEFGCRENNKNGIILSEMIDKFCLSILNDERPTYFQANKNYTEILDLFISSSNLADKVDLFTVDYDYDMTSDHYPIRIHLNMSPQINCPQLKNKYNFKKANWSLFREMLMVRNDELNSDNVDELNLLISNNIINAANHSIPKVGEKIYKTALPKEIIKIIKDRRKARRKAKKYNNPLNRTQYNRLTAILKRKIIEHRNKNWALFVERMGKNPTSSRPFWIRINKFRNLKAQKNHRIPSLIQDGKSYETNEGKAQLFSSILASTFSPNTVNDASFDDLVKTEISNFEQKHSDFSCDLTSEEIKKAISESKKDSATGLDKIHYQMLKNLPETTISDLRDLFNKCIRINKIPEAWKIAKISMIPKKDDDKSNPNNYRPISVTSCLGKILEKVMAKRLYSFLESNKLLVNTQSGFRKHRRTADNLFFLTQKVAESFNRKKNTGCLFFDISKAFDKVWHEGLFYKLIKMKTHPYLIKFIMAFLHERKFIINVEEALSAPVVIKAGVPQGACISPLLFNIFINDIPQRNVPNVSQSLLFADDLATMFFFKKKGNVEDQINKYLKEIERWLTKWKMKMAPNKCRYMVFTQNKTIPKLKIFLQGEQITHTEKMKFLGLTFDSRLNFNAHINEIRTRCKDRLNIVKILSNRNWHLKPQILGNIYKSLVSSIIDYSFVCLHLISETDLSRLQAIQNTAIRAIFKLPYDCPRSILCGYEAELGISQISDRLDDLNERFLRNCLANSNALVARLLEEYKRGFEARYTNRVTPLCTYYLTLENI